MNLAKRLREYRKACGFSQQQIADKLRIHRATYSYYELGRTEPSWDNMVRLARIFNVTLYELLGVQDEDPDAYPLPQVRQPDIISLDEEEIYNKRVGTTKVGDLTLDEKKLILSYRSLTKEQREDLMHSLVTLGLKSEKE